MPAKPFFCKLPCSEFGIGGCLRKILLAKHRIRQLALARGIRPRWISSLGAINVDPKHLAFWVATEQDWERDQLLEDLTFRPDCLEAILQCGYPEEVVRFVGVAAESQQTVDRDFLRRWSWAMK
jgi:hypothetical protein